MVRLRLIRFGLADCCSKQQQQQLLVMADKTQSRQYFDKYQ